MCDDGEVGIVGVCGVCEWLGVCVFGGEEGDVQFIEVGGDGVVLFDWDCMLDCEGVVQFRGLLQYFELYLVGGCDFGEFFVVGEVVGGDFEVFVFEGVFVLLVDVDCGYGGVIWYYDEVVEIDVGVCECCLDVFVICIVVDCIVVCYGCFGECQLGGYVDGIFVYEVVFQIVEVVVDGVVVDDCEGGCYGVSMLFVGSSGGWLGGVG